jgi:hypothetical protein
MNWSIHFLVAAQRVFTCTEAARCHRDDTAAAVAAVAATPSHDAFPVEAQTASRSIMARV